MTHEELLQKIVDRLNECTTHDYAPANLAIALRKVVELHKPEPMPLSDEAEDDVCGFCWDSGARWFYPCPTIDAIEQELK